MFNVFSHLRLTSFALVALLGSSATAAEIELRAQAQPTDGLVRLGDIAIIHAASDREASSLTQIELVPAPSSGRTRMLKLRDVRDLLALQGVKLTDHHFSGATQTQIGGGTEQASSTKPIETTTINSASAKTSPAAKVAKSQQSQAQARVQNAIVQHLRDHAEAQASWQVAVNLTPEQVALMSARNGEVIVAGGTAPWTGSQEFTVTVRTSQGLAKLPVKAEVSVPDRIVVARRPLRRGEILQAADLELTLPPLGSEPAGAIEQLEDAIGRETTHSIATGQALESAWLRKPLLVKRGEVVTVFARAANVQVRTNARAVDDGGKDDVVLVERIDNRQRFAARVIGVQELEVFVSSVNVGQRK